MKGTAGGRHTLGKSMYEKAKACMMANMSISMHIIVDCSAPTVTYVDS